MKNKQSRKSIIIIIVIVGLGKQYYHCHFLNWQKFKHAIKALQEGTALKGNAHNIVTLPNFHAISPKKGKE